MVAKLFVFGLPGSGKSSVARIISKYARVRQWSTTHINDYAILLKMYQEDTKRQFKPADFGGFDVLDLSVFDTVLRRLEHQVIGHISSTKLDEIVLIEFSRNDYGNAFQQFSREFLNDAYFLYLSVDLETCKKRIRARIANPTTIDDHFVSEYIFSTYYNEDNGQDIPRILERDYRINRQRVRNIDNNCSLEAASKKINSFIDRIMNSVPIPLSTADMPANCSSGEYTANDTVDALANNSGGSRPDYTVDATEIRVGAS